MYKDIGDCIDSRDLELAKLVSARCNSGDIMFQSFCILHVLSSVFFFRNMLEYLSNYMWKIRAAFIYGAHAGFSKNSNFIKK